MTDKMSVLVRQANPVPTAAYLAEEEFAAALAAVEASFTDEMGRGWAARWRRRLGRRPAGVFAVAMAVTVLVVTVPLLLLFGDNGTVADPTVPTPSTAAPPTTAATTTAAPTTVATTTAVPMTTLGPDVSGPPVPEIAWERVPHQPAFADTLIGEWVASFVRGGPGLVGVGYVYAEGDERPYGAVFLSSDGREWERIDDPFLSEHDFLEEEGPADIAVGSDGKLVVVGGDGEDAAVWVSDDGTSWNRVSAETLTAPDHQMMLSVASGGPGFVAVGEDGPHPAFWVSPNGSEWSRVVDDDLLAGDDPRVVGVVAGGPGFVALGDPGWVSRDGYEWEPLAVDTFADESPDCWPSVSVHPRTGRLTAFGCNGLWTSDDGYDWTLAARDLPLGGPPPGADADWDGDIGVAGGLNRWHSLWVTGDAGATWTRIEPVDPVFSEFFDQSVAVTFLDGRWVVVGQGIDGAAVWIGTPGG